MQSINLLGVHFGFLILLGAKLVDLLDDLDASDFLITRPLDDDLVFLVDIDDVNVALLISRVQFLL